MPGRLFHSTTALVQVLLSNSYLLHFLEVGREKPNQGSDVIAPNLLSNRNKAQSKISGNISMTHPVSH